MTKRKLIDDQWRCYNITDLGCNGPRDVCEYCGYPNLRFAHHLKRSTGEIMVVGCCCASQICSNYNGVEAERIMMNYAGRRKHWASRVWLRSARGNDHIKIGDLAGGIFGSGGAIGWWARLNGAPCEFGKDKYPTQVEAKLALFDYIFPAKDEIYRALKETTNV